jgi:CIC family chloride channel protein
MARRRPVRAATLALGHWIERTSYLPKWIVLGAAIGVIAGLGAVVFYSALELATHVFLGVLAGYRPPTPAGEGDLIGSTSYARPWAIPLVVALGGLCSGILVFTFAPEAEGHGTDAAIDAIHHNPRKIRLRAVAVKIVASALTIGAGGSGGREGPTAQISAGFGSFLARLLDLSPEDGRIAVSIGIGSGIGAIFGAPLGGAVLSADIVYRDDFETAALVPGLIASIVAYTIFGLSETFSPLFGYVATSFHFHKPIELVWFAVIGVVAGLIGLAYAKGFYGVVDLTHRLPGSRMLKPAVGGLLVGCIALAVPEVLGTGYGWIQRSLGPGLLSIPLWIVLALPLLRILATSLSIGSGGSGGVFGPGMVIGAFTGAAIWRLLEPIAPGIPKDPAPFVIVGMMACFGGISRAPLAVMLMVAEMTGSLNVLAPAMIAVGLAYLIVRRSDDTIYRAQLKNRDRASAQRLSLGVPLTGSLDAARAMQPPKLVLGAAITVAHAYPVLRDAGVPGAPVVDGEGRLVGTVSTEQIDQARVDPARRDVPIGNVADRTAPTVPRSATLDSAIEALTSAGGWVTVVSGNREVAGIVSTGDVIRATTVALESNLERLAHVTTGSTPVELEIGAQSTAVGRPLRDRVLPPGCVVVSILRSHALRFPDGESVLEPGDQLTILARRDQVTRLRDLLASPPGTSTPPTTELLAVPATPSDPGAPSGHVQDHSGHRPPRGSDGEVSS